MSTPQAETTDRAIAAEERPAAQLDDIQDREELRNRYYGLLQEVRVLLPGSQVFVAFLLTVPFNNRFTELDQLGQWLYGTALAAGVVAIVSFIAPTALHRLGPRRVRAARLEWSVRLTRIGLLFLAVSLISSLAVVTRLVFGSTTAIGASIGAGLIVVLAWVVLPLVAFPAGPEGE